MFRLILNLFAASSMWWEQSGRMPLFLIQCGQMEPTEASDCLNADCKKQQKQPWQSTLRDRSQLKLLTLYLEHTSSKCWTIKPLAIVDGASTSLYYDDVVHMKGLTWPIKALNSNDGLGIPLLVTFSRAQSILAFEAWHECAFFPGQPNLTIELTCSPGLKASALKSRPPPETLLSLGRLVGWSIQQI